jgi:XTP/dITP diphosphohydrolase
MPKRSDSYFMKIVLASGNKKKLSELQDLLAPINHDITPQSSFNITDAKETGLSFIENAIIKARHASEHANMPAIADDSGLCVTALKGAPGIYSSRYSGQNATDKHNNNKLLESLKTVPDSERNAYFYCALCYISHAKDPTPLIVTAKWNGVILSSPQGSEGFGYDPLFYLPEHHCTSAELPSTIKNNISHRGLAMQRFLPVLIDALSR